MEKKKYAIIKWLLYSVLLFVFFILQTTPHLFSICGIRPVLLLPLIFAVGFFEEEFSSCIFAACGGLLIDYSAMRPLGFSALFLLIITLTISLLVKYLMKSTFWNFLFLSAVGTWLFLCIDFCFFYALWGYSGLGGQFANECLIALYSVAVSPLIYLLIHKIALYFQKIGQE